MDIISQKKALTRGVFMNLSRGGAQHPLGPENPLKSIDFSDLPEYAPGSRTLTNVGKTSFLSQPSYIHFFKTEKRTFTR